MYERKGKTIYFYLLIYCVIFFFYFYFFLVDRVIINHVDSLIFRKEKKNETNSFFIKSFGNKTHGYVRFITITITFISQGGVRSREK